MESVETVFEQLTQSYCERSAAVAPGKMMSSPAITHKGKVFIFLSRKGSLVFKLGKNFDPQPLGCPAIVEFNPFKNKGPLRGWFECPADCSALWQSLSEQAYTIIQE